MKLPGFNYLGTKRPYVDLVVKSISGLEFDTFCDLTAGSSIIPYIVKQVRPDCKIVTNDICYFCYLISRVLFGTRDNSIINITSEDLLKIEPIEGFLYKNSQENPRIFGYWPKEVSSFIDALVVYYKDNPFILLSIGTFLNRSDFRYRNIGGFMKSFTSKSTKGDVCNHIISSLNKFFSWNMNLSESSFTCYNLDWFDCVDKHSSFRNAIVNIDPAWPADSETSFGRFSVFGKDYSNPYSFYDYIIDRVLLQQEKQPVDYNYTIDDYKGRIKRFLFKVVEKGGRDFIIWYQNTRGISDEYVYNLFNFLSPEFNIVKIDGKDRRLPSRCREIYLTIQHNER